MHLLSRSSKRFKNRMLMAIILPLVVLFAAGYCSGAIRTVTLLAPNENLQSLVTEFNQANKDIRLVLKIATVNAGQPVVTSEADLIVPGLNANFNDKMFLDLNRLLRDSAQAQQALRWALPHILRSSGLRVVPISHNPYFVFAQRQQLLNAGIDVNLKRWTWADFAALTTRLMAPPGTPWGTVLDLKTWAIPFVQGGGDFIKGPYDKARDGLEMVYQIQAIYSSHAPVSTLGFGGSFTYFTNGTAATSIFPAHTLMQLTKSNFPAKDLGWIALPLPGDSSTAPGVTYFGQFLGIAAGSPRWADAWKVIEWFLSPAGAAALLRTGSIPLAHNPASFSFISSIYGNNAETLFNREFNLMLNPFADVISSTKIFNEVLPGYFHSEKSIEETIAELNYRTKAFRE